MKIFLDENNKKNLQKLKAYKFLLKNTNKYIIEFRSSENGYGKFIYYNVYQITMFRKKLIETIILHCENHITWK